MDQSRIVRSQTRVQEFREQILEQIPSIKIGEKKPISVLYEDESVNRVNISSLVYCDDTVVEGCLRALCSMIDKANQHIRLSTDIFFPQLLLYSQAACGMADRESVINMAVSACDLFPQLCEFHQAVFALFRNIVQQMHIVRKQDPVVFAISKSVEFFRAWRSLGDLLAIAIQIDEIMLCRPNIRCLNMEMIKDLEEKIEEANDGIKKDPGKVAGLQTLHFSLKYADEYCMSGNAFRRMYEDTIGDLDASKQFAKEMFNAVGEMYGKWEKSADEDQPDKRQLLALCGLAVYYHHHFANFADKSLIRKVLSSHKKIAAFALIGDIRFFPGDFILREVGDHMVFNKKELASVTKARNDSKINDEIFEAVMNEALQLAKDTDVWAYEVYTRIRERRSNSGNLAKVCLDISELFLKGVRYADTLTRQVQILTSRYKFNEDVETVILKKNDAFKILSLIGAVKTIAFTFEENWRTFNESTALASQQWRCHAVKLVERARTALKESTNIAENEIKCRNGALTVASEMLLATMSSSRMVAILTAMDIAGINKLLKAVDQKHLSDLINRIDNLITPRQLASRTTNCSFLVHSSTIILVFWESLIDRKASFAEIAKWLEVASDCAEYWRKTRHRIEGVKPNYFELIRETFLSKVCHLIENDLRISTHQHLQVDKKDCLSDEDSAYIKLLLRNGTLRIYDEIVDIGDFVTRYLEKTFYNLTIIAPHDAQTYAKMANYAKIKYGLEVIGGDLPQGGIDESCDMVDLVKNLPSVVVNYNFSMTRELFIEKQSPNRKLHIFTRNDLISALRKFGNGLVPTATNIAYQILRKKLNIFYQFLSDDHIRAQIDHDIRLMNLEKEENGESKYYTVEMAENFTKKIAKIGGTISTGASGSTGGSTKGSIISDQNNDDDDKPITYIDKFRVLITQIGNTLGFVRTIGLASKSVETEMGEFMSSEITRLVDELRIEDRQHEAIERIKNQFKPSQAREASDFNHLLVNVFRDALNKNLTYLSNFYMIIPAISQSYVEYMLTCRNRSKQSGYVNHNDYTIVNDGFPVGIAYLLTVLGTWSEFEELNWFKSVDTSITAEIVTLIEAQTQGSRLKKERLGSLQDEYDELRESLCASRIFFEFEEFVNQPNNNETDDDWF